MFKKILLILAGLFIVFVVLSLYKKIKLAKTGNGNIVTRKLVIFCFGKKICPGKNPRVKNIKILQQSGVRPRYSPNGDMIIFDRKNADGFYDLYLSDLEGRITRKITENNPKITQRNNGNGIIHPSGKFIVFISEAPQHELMQFPSLGDSGVGLYSNLWATDMTGSKFWQLTHIPIKITGKENIPAYATVNPLFSKDGRRLYWTERYGAGGHNNWGSWRIKEADFIVENGIPTIKNERVIYTPKAGNYVTEMAYLDPSTLIVAGNLDGQYEYGMDQYKLNLITGQSTNLTNTPDVWEEDSSLTPNGRLIYMTNIDSPFHFDFNKNWASQPVQRDYYLMNLDGSSKEKLTYFNDPTAPEYLGKNILVAASDVAPDGKSMVGTLGVDFAQTNATKRDMELKVVLIEFNESL